MSIEFNPAFDRTQTSFARITTIKPPPSRKRIAANRRNARKSTGPRTPAGKRRSSQNSLKHGLCSAFAIPSCEDSPTFNTFIEELREEFQPQTATQTILFQQIAQLMWNLRRFPEAQAKMFHLELEQTQGKRKLTPSDLIAERFNETPTNGFALLGRYERANQAMLLRLMRQYEQLKKRHATRPYDEDEPRVPRAGEEPAISPAAMVQQQIAFEKRERESKQFIPPRNDRELKMDQANWQKEQYQSQKRTHHEPTENPVGDPETEDSHATPHAPVTKRTHCEDQE